VKLPFLPWLLPSGATEDRILVVQTGSPALLTRLVDSLRGNSPEASLTVLLQRDMRKLVPEREDIEYIDNQGPKPSFIKMLGERRFDRAYVLYSNEPGYWKLKLLPFLIGVGEVRVVNENLDWFPLDLRHTDSLAAHLRWRLESSVTFAGDMNLGAVWNAARAVAYPAVLAYLAGYEWLQTRRAGPEASAWKDENKPDLGAP